MERLVDINVLIDSITYRDPPLWIDQPPPERDLELGIGETRSLAHTASQRGCEEGVAGDVKRLKATGCGSSSRAAGASSPAYWGDHGAIEPAPSSHAGGLTV